MLGALVARGSSLRVVPRFVFSLLLAVGGTASSAFAQDGAEGPSRSVLLRENLDTLGPRLNPGASGKWRGDADSLPGSPVRALPLANARADEELPTGRTVLASAGGVALGSALGLLLLSGAKEANIEEDRYPDWYRSEPDAGESLFAASLIAFAAGGPIGAVEGAGIDRRKMDGYIVAGVGEFVVGGMGFGIGRLIHDSPTSRLAGLALGVTVGAAAGALLVASKERRSAITYRSGFWHVSSPAIRVTPGFVPGASPRVSVDLVAVRW